MSDAWVSPEPIPDFELVDQDGKTFRLSRYEDDWLLVGFVYTRCNVATACPLTMSKMRAVQQAWTKTDHHGHSLELLTLTFDAEHDEPEQLRDFGALHGVDNANWTLATGPERLLNRELPSLFNVLAIPDGRGGLNHNVKVALLRPGLLDGAEWTSNAFDPPDVIDMVLKN